MISYATHKHLFYSEMAKLLEAGFDIRKAAAVLEDTKLPAAQAALLKDLHQGLAAGGSIASSFGKDKAQISELERSLITAGERGGKLAPAFQHLADYFGMIATTRHQMVVSMIYPLVILHLGIFIATVPATMMKGIESGWEMAGSFLTLLLGVYMLVFCLFISIRALWRLAPETLGIDKLINRIPWLGKVRVNLAMARFCKVYHSCLLAGISMAETVQCSAVAAQSAVIRAACTGLTQAAKAGTSLGPQLIAAEVFPKAFSRSYATGEEAGTLDIDLARWSKKFQGDAESAAKIAAMMVPRVLYLAIMIFVGWQIVRFFDGYYRGLEELTQ
jgi:type IV pilus assembly protein PilC